MQRTRSAGRHNRVNKELRPLRLHSFGRELDYVYAALDRLGDARPRRSAICSRRRSPSDPRLTLENQQLRAALTDREHNVVSLRSRDEHRT